MPTGRQFRAGRPGPPGGRAVYERLLRQGVIVRPVGGYGLPSRLRITIGTPEQNDVQSSARLWLGKSV